MLKKMKTYNVTNRVSVQARTALKNLLEGYSNYVFSYFIFPQITAEQRRRREAEVQEKYPPVRFIKGEKEIVVRFLYEESCSHVYFKAFVFVNGERKSIKVIRDLLKGKK